MTLPDTLLACYDKLVARVSLQYVVADIFKVVPEIFSVGKHEERDLRMSALYTVVEDRRNKFCLRYYHF